MLKLIGWEVNTEFGKISLKIMTDSGDVEIVEMSNDIYCEILKGIACRIYE